MLKCYWETWKSNPGKLLFANQIGRPMSANKIARRKLWPILDVLAIDSHVVGDSQRNSVKKSAKILRPNAPKSTPHGRWIQKLVGVSDGI